jgi:antibiotic biosynthesis monooxygenase (ABM) superfamily enzyme
MARQPGSILVALLKEREKEAVHQMVIRFQSLETAAAWRDSADHKALSPKIHTLDNIDVLGNECSQYCYSIDRLPCHIFQA